MILALDFETSGLDPQRNAPISLGIAVMDGSEIVDRQEWIIGPTHHWKTGKVERSYEIAALEVSGITWCRIKKAPHPKTVLREVADFISKNDARRLPIVAFNAAFDHSFWSTLLNLGGDWHPSKKGVWQQPKSPLLGGWVCARELAKEYLTLDNYSLNDVAGAMQMARSSDLHGALEDAILAGQIYHQFERANQ